MANYCNQAIGDDGRVNLDANSILGDSPKGFNLEMLFDPFEEKLDLPAVLIKQSNLFRRKLEVVGNEDESPVHFHIIKGNFPKLLWILFLVFKANKRTNLVTHYTRTNINSPIF